MEGREERRDEEDECRVEREGRGDGRELDRTEEAWMST